MTEERVVPMFIPALSLLLIRAEDLKGEPLTVEEVINIRDSSPCIMMTASDAERMADRRGRDIDPENVWFEWQQLRVEMGRGPALDPGAKMTQISSVDPVYQQTIRDAQSTLGKFRELLARDDFSSPKGMIKTRPEMTAK